MTASGPVSPLTAFLTWEEGHGSGMRELPECVLRRDQEIASRRRIELLAEP